MPSNEPESLPTIRCKPAGPYLVTSLATFKNSRGEAIASKETIALCRCGRSSNKPFCDGTHVKIGFEDGKKPDRTEDKRSDYAGKASDPQLLDVLRDAVKRGLDTGRIQSVFDTYRCLSGVRDDTGYGELTASLDTSGCPTDEQRKNWRESRVDDALIRRGPAKTAPRVGWLKKGAVVEKLGVDGEWLKVRTWQGLTGYVHGSLLADY